MKPPKGHIQLSRELVHSKAFEGLSSHATRLLLDLVFYYNGANNGAIRYGTAQARRWLQCSQRTAVRTFNELRKAGLIETTQRGNFSFKEGAGEGIASAWRLTFKPSPKPSVVKLRARQWATRRLPPDAGESEKKYP